MTTDAQELTTAQSRRPPLQSLAAVIDHVNALRQFVDWDGIGILCDKGPSAVLLVVVSNEDIVGVSRFCLSVEDSVSAVQAYSTQSGEVNYRTWQGQTLSPAQLVSLDELTKVWRSSHDQSAQLTNDELTELFRRIQDGTLKKGRGQSISEAVSRQVYFDAHGRCMFEGCGVDLSFDPVTGVYGNYATLAHNVASAETGTRGVLYLSGKLNNDPNNIVLLCDVHHRIVDTIAKADYPAHRMSEMRRRHCAAATDLLDGLSKLPIAGYCVTWPIHQQQITVPNALQVSQSLAPIGARLDGQLQVIADNDDSLRTAEPEALWKIMPGHINTTADRILMQIRSHQYRAALFAMGLMPALIALGAKLGNKCEITPMLRHREHGLWFWPESGSRGDFFDVDGVEVLGSSEKSVVLLLALTAEPGAMEITSTDLDLPVVQVRARDMGNGSLAHPADGFVFRQRMQELLHRLQDQHGVQLIHLLPCASNAACVFFGQAFDNFHPELMIYDFVDAGKSMVPRLRIYNDRNKCVIESVDT